MSKFRSRHLTPFACLAVLAPAVSAQEAKDPHANARHEPHWGYTDSAGTVGPAKWGTLAGDAVCGTGHQQSPIDLTSAGPAAASQAPAPLSFDYHALPLRMVYNGHTVQLSLEAGGSVSAGGATYKLAQLHFHAPSEHTVDGRHYPLEVHLVHVDAAGKPVLVVGVLVQAGKKNDAIDAAFHQLPQREGVTVSPAGATVDPSALLPTSRAFFRYEGSLTTPPCTEGIHWYVLSTPIEMSAEEIAAFTALPRLNACARPTQPLAGRAVERSAP